jgi:hypothetical protein
MVTALQELSVPEPGRKAAFLRIAVFHTWPQGTSGTLSMSSGRSCWPDLHIKTGTSTFRVCTRSLCGYKILGTSVNLVAALSHKLGGSWFNSRQGPWKFSSYLFFFVRIQYICNLLSLWQKRVPRNFLGSHADISAVLVVRNIKGRIVAQHSFSPLCLHNLLQQRLTFTFSKTVSIVNAKWCTFNTETLRYNSVEIPKRCSFVIEFIIPKFVEGWTCFERYIAHHQELWTVFAACGLYAHMGTGRCQDWVGKFTHLALTKAGHHMCI